MSLKRATISRETLVNVSTVVAFGLHSQALGHFLCFFMGHHLPFRPSDERDTHELSPDCCTHGLGSPRRPNGAKRDSDTGVGRRPLSNQSVEGWQILQTKNLRALDYAIRRAIRGLRGTNLPKHDMDLVYL